MEHLRPYAFFDGKIVPVQEVLIHPFDLGFMRGMCVFDFLRFKDKKPLFLKEHLDRLFNSARILGIPACYTREEYTSFINELITKNNEDYGTIRMIISAGPLTHGFTITHPYVIIFIEPYHTYPDTAFSNGVSLMTVQAERVFPEAKHTNYSIPGAHEAERAQQGALEILYIDNHDMVREPATSNICMVKDGIIYTPQTHILTGITLLKAIEAAKNTSIELVQREINLKELLAADEVFITATNKDILPIVKIDNTTIAQGVPGPVSKKILDAYIALTNQSS